MMFLFIIFDYPSLLCLLCENSFFFRFLPLTKNHCLIEAISFNLSVSLFPLSPHYPNLQLSSSIPLAIIIQGFRSSFFHTPF